MENIDGGISNLEREILDNRNEYDKSIKKYESLGVKQFKTGLMKTVGKLSEFLPNYSLRKGTSRESLKRYKKITFLNELIHSPQILWACYELGKSISEENYSNAALCYGLMVLNGYLTLTQRYNRARINAILDKNF